MTVGQRIQAERKKMGVSQKQLGEYLGVSGSMIGQYENDLRSPKIETLEKIAVALATTVPYLKSGDTTSEVIYGDHDIAEILDPNTKTSADLSSQRLKDFLDSYPGGFDSFKQHIIKKYASQESLLASFGKLNREGQQKAVERVEELAEIPKYQRTPSRADKK